MKQPNNYKDNYNKYYSTQGIKLHPFFDPSNPSSTIAYGNYTNVVFQQNMFSDLIHGFEGYASNITFGNNRLERCWYSAVDIGGQTNRPSFGTSNTVILPATSENTTQLYPSADAVGFYVSGNASVSDNVIQGSQTSLRKQIGIVSYSSYAPTTIERNVISNAYDGIELVLDNSGTSHPIQNNKFSSNQNAVVVIPDFYSTPKNLEARCNTFDNPNNRSSTVGINVLDMATLGDMGSATVPNGNKFSNISAPVKNDGGLPFSYYRYASPDEDFANVGIQGNAGGTLFNTGISGSNACGGPGNYGVNLRTSFVADSSSIAAIMDSVLAGQVPYARLKNYHKLVANYHEVNVLMPKLEAFISRLPLADKESFNTLGLRLLEYYVHSHQPGRAQAIKALLARNSQDPEVQYAIQLSEIFERTGSQPLISTGQLSAADKAVLNTIATSATSRASLACLVLRSRAIPCNCEVAPYRVASVLPAARLSSPVPSTGAAENALGQSYPNPAFTQATIPYEFPVLPQAAQLVIRDVATGTERQRVVLSTESLRGQASIDLHALSPGVYSYSLEVNGKRWATKKLVIIR